MVIGHVILVILFDYTNAAVFVNSFFLAVILLVLSLITGIAHDLYEEQREKGKNIQLDRHREDL